MNATGERMNPRTSKEINRRRRPSSSSIVSNIFLRVLILHSFLFLLVISLNEVTINYSPVHSPLSLLYKVSSVSLSSSLFASATPFSNPSVSSSSSSNPVLPSSFVFKIGEFLLHLFCCNKTHTVRHILM